MFQYLSIYEGVSRSFRTGRLQRVRQMVQLSANRCSCISVLWFSLVSFAAMILYVASRVFIVVVVVYFVDSVRKLLDTSSYTLQCSSASLGPVYPFSRLELTSPPSIRLHGMVKVKGKVVPVLQLSTTPWKRIGEWKYSSTHSLTSTLDGGEWSVSRPGPFTPRERAPGTHWIGGWAGPRAVLDTVVKRKIPSPCWESNPRTPIVQPVAQRYTDWAITALLT
jgi:hypothetical protein